MAIFIDNVMEASIRRKQQERGANAAQMEVHLKDLLAKMIRKEKIKASTMIEHQVKMMNARVSNLLDVDLGQQLERSASKIDAEFKADTEDMTITREQFDSWLHEPAFLTMLEDLDIGTANKSELFDVLDCDLSGELEVDEVISGLMKLRGPSDKTDA